MHGEQISQEELPLQVEALRNAVQVRLRKALGFTVKPRLERPKSLVMYRGIPYWLIKTDPFPSLPELIELAKAHQLHFVSDPPMVRPEDQDSVVAHY